MPVNFKGDIDYPAMSPLKTHTAAASGKIIAGTKITRAVLLCISLLLVAFTTRLSARQGRLLVDQNPRYLESLNRYARVADSLTRMEGTTIQQTYKAYDWYQARQERRQRRLEWRRSNRPSDHYFRGYSSSFWLPYSPYLWMSWLGYWHRNTVRYCP